MIEMFELLLSKSWEFFQITWPGFDFSIGSAFLAVLVSAGALTALTKMTGVSLLINFKGFSSRGGNNNNIKVSNERKDDTK